LHLTRQPFVLLRILFGIIWLLNAALQANPLYIHDHLFQSFHVGIEGQPQRMAQYTRSIVGLTEVVGSTTVALGTIGIDAMLAFSLLTGIWLRVVAWIGLAYSLFMWSTVGGMGGPYTRGATDPGTAIVYALAFALIVMTQPQKSPGMASNGRATGSPESFHGLGRILFGLLWAFDAYWKWHPYFLRHGFENLVQAQGGQPAWILGDILE
jgi:hypothetical protein